MKNKFLSTCSETKVLSSTQLAFSAKFPKNGRFCLPGSAFDLVNQRRGPNPTVAPRDLKLRFRRDRLLRFPFSGSTESLLSGCLRSVAIFLQTASRYYSREKCLRYINDGYGLIQIFTEKLRIPPTKLWHVWSKPFQYYRPTDFVRKSTASLQIKI